MKIVYDMDVDGQAAEIVLEFTGSNGSSSFIRRITFSGIELDETTDTLPNSFEYIDSAENISVTGSFNDFEQMILSVIWDFEYNGIQSSGEQNYTLEHLYTTSRFDNELEILEDIYF